MSLTISTSSLRALIPLTEKRERLAHEISVIEKQIATVLGGSTRGGGKVSSGAVRGDGRIGKGRPAKASKKRGKRGAVKELILAGLREAGEAGIAVKHLAVKLGIKPQNIHVWFHTTGKKSGLTEAVGRGVYRLKQAIGVVTPTNEFKAPKPKAIGHKSKNELK